MKLLLLIPCAAVLLVACERQSVVTERTPDDRVQSVDEVNVESRSSATKTLETMRLDAALDAFEENASPENIADVKKAFAELDGEIAELEGHIARVGGEQRAQAAAKLHDLQTYRDAQKARLARAEGGAPGAEGESKKVRVDTRTGAEKAVDTAVRAGREIEEGAKKVGDALEDVVKDVAR